MSIPLGFISRTNSENRQEEEIINAIIQNDLPTVRTIASKSPKFIKKTTFNIEKQSNIQGSILPLSSLSLMHIAAFFDSLEIFVFLEMHAHLSPSILNASSIHPIQYAIYGNSLEVASYILNKYPDEALIDASLSYALYYCAASSPNAKNDHMIRLLQMKKAPFVYSPDNILCPIHKAIRLKNIPVLKGLLKVYNSQKKNFTEERGIMTPLMTSISYGLSSGVDLLLQVGEDPLFITPDGRCALSHACFCNRKVNGKDSNIEIIEKLLISIGENSIEPFVKNISGPIQWICQSKSPQIAKMIFEYHPEIDVNRVDENFISAPTTLAKKDMPVNDIIEMLTLFIEKGYEINRYDLENGQKTILESFCFTISPKLEVVKFLLNNGANPYLPFIGNNKAARKRTIYINALEKPNLRPIMMEYEQTHQK